MHVPTSLLELRLANLETTLNRSIAATSNPHTTTSTVKIDTVIVQQYDHISQFLQAIISIQNEDSLQLVHYEQLEILLED